MKPKLTRQRRQQFYKFLTENHYFWDRKDTNHIWIALDGCFVFSDKYNSLVEMAQNCNIFHLDGKFDKVCGKTFHTFKHR